MESELLQWDHLTLSSWCVQPDATIPQMMMMISTINDINSLHSLQARLRDTPRHSETDSETLHAAPRQTPRQTPRHSITDSETLRDTPRHFTQTHRQTSYDTSYLLWIEASTATMVLSSQHAQNQHKRHTTQSSFQCWFRLCKWRRPNRGRFDRMWLWLPQTQNQHVPGNKTSYSCLLRWFNALMTLSI